MKFDRNKLLTIKDVEKAKELIGKKVFIANGLKRLRYYVEMGIEVRTLKKVSGFSDRPFYYEESSRPGSVCYPYEEPQKKYEPFTWEDRELLRGKWVRLKSDPSTESQIVELIHKDENEYNGDLEIGHFNNFDEMPAGVLLADFEFVDGTPCGKEVEE